MITASQMRSFSHETTAKMKPSNVSAFTQHQLHNINRPGGKTSHSN